MSLSYPSLAAELDSVTGFAGAIGGKAAGEERSGWGSRRGIALLSRPTISRKYNS